MADPTPDRSPQAFVDQHLSAVWRYLRMQGAGAVEADDLTQEAFVAGLQKGAMNFDPPAARAFLRRAARFAFLHHLRDQNRDRAIADAVDELWDRDCGNDDGDALVDDLQQCVDKLDGRARRAVRLTYGIGGELARPRDEVAALIDIQPNGLKTLLQRTRKALRACIERVKQ